MIVEFSSLQSETQVEHSEKHPNQRERENLEEHQGPIRFRVDGVKPNFLQSDEALTKLEPLIDELLEMKKSQQEIDMWYSCFVEMMQNE